MPKPVLRTDVLDMKDLKEGHVILKGTVRNVIDFGAFVDIGVHQDGLVHISEMTERYIKTSTGGSVCWGCCRCTSDWSGFEEEANQLVHEGNQIKTGKKYMTGLQIG